MALPSGSDKLFVIHETGMRALWETTHLQMAWNKDFRVGAGEEQISSSTADAQGCALAAKGSLKAAARLEARNRDQRSCQSRHRRPLYPGASRLLGCSVGVVSNPYEPGTKPNDSPPLKAHLDSQVAGNNSCHLLRNSFLFLSSYSHKEPIKIICLLEV